MPSPSRPMEPSATPLAARNKRTIFLVIAGIAIVLVLAAVLTFLTAEHYVSSKIDFVVEKIAFASGISPTLIRGVTYLVTIPFFICAGILIKNFKDLLNPIVDPLHVYRSKAGVVMVAYVGVFYIVLWWASRDALASKFCAETPAGLQVHDTAGADPTYPGVEYKPCTLDQVKELKSGVLKPTEIFPTGSKHYPWFDSVVGKPRVWYSNEGNVYRFFDKPGIDPDTAQTLLPITPAVIAAYREHAQLSHSKEQAAVAQQQRSSQLETESTEAQAKYDAGDFRASLNLCRDVLTTRKDDETCGTLAPKASVKLAHQLVDQGQLQLQRADFDEAYADAQEAAKLDPDNEPAKHLMAAAHTLKKQAGTN